MRRVAFIAYHFPPMGGGLCRRSLKFVRYLPRFGWKPTVFTVPEDAESLYTDADLLGEVPQDVSVVRVGDYLSWRVRGVLKRWGAERALEKALRAFHNPDVHRIWARGVFRELTQRHRERPFDALVTTSAPYSAHLVGLWGHTETGLPWVADFRDSWTLGCSYQAPTPLHGWLDRRLETAIYRSCSHLVLNTPGDRADVLREFAVPPAKVSVLTNGYDPADFPPELGRPPRDGRLHLLYLGGLRGDWFEGPFLRCLHGFAAAHPAGAVRLRVHFVGADGPAGPLLSELGLDRLSRLHGFVPHADVPGWLGRCHAYVLLLPASGRPLGWVPQKLYIYLRGGRAVLGLVPPGSSADIVSQSAAAAFIADPSDIPGCIGALERLWERFANDDLPLGPSAEARIRRYSRVELTRRLAGILDELAGVSDEPARQVVHAGRRE